MSDWIKKHRDNHRWKSAAASRQLGESLARWARAIASDVVDTIRYNLLKQHLNKPAIAPARPPAPKEKSRPAPTEKPLIFASYAVDTKWTGSHRYCGGEKVLNNMIHVLRRHGYEAYMVTLDGKQAGWLADQAPCISLAEFQRLRTLHPSARCVTSWIDAHAFLDACDEFYYWDMELATSSDYHFPRIWDYMKSGRVRGLAVLNRAIQAWFQTIFSRRAVVLRCMADERYWKPADERRIPNRVGYMNEGSHTSALIQTIKEQTLRDGLAVDFHEISGDEPQVIAEMQTCALFVVTNIGKSPVWGESGPLGPYESMACGTVPICFDIIGPWETIQQNYNGVIVPRDRHDLMAQAVSEILRDQARLTAMSQRARDVFQSAHSLEARWPYVREFLDLDEA